jgi:hypothetical protein
VSQPLRIVWGMDRRHDPTLVISCDDCAMQRTSTCADCVVTFVLRSGVDGDEPPAIALDHDEEHAVRLLARAGLVPELRFRVAS